MVDVPLLDFGAMVGLLGVGVLGETVVCFSVVGSSVLFSSTPVSRFSSAHWLIP